MERKRYSLLVALSLLLVIAGVLVYRPKTGPAEEDFTPTMSEPSVERMPDEEPLAHNKEQMPVVLTNLFDGVRGILFPQDESKAVETVRVPMKTGVHIRTLANLREAEERLETNFDYVVAYVHWGNESAFPKELSAHLSDTGKTIVIFWNAMDYNKEEQDGFSYASILSGEWDDYVSSFASDVAAHDGQVFIIPFEEINGYWTPWSGVTEAYGSLEEYRATYGYLREKFRGMDHVRFGWVVNNVSVPNTLANRIENYYPGNEYVDFIGVNGFNFGDPWMSFHEIFTSVVERLRTYGKPLYITSIGTAEGSRKSQWVKDFFTHPIIVGGSVQGWMWFNEDKERDWRFWSDSETEEVFKNMFRESGT